MLKKSINSANINSDSRKRNLNPEWRPEKRTSPRPGAVWSLRLWTFFSTLATLFKIEFAAGRPSGQMKGAVGTFLILCFLCLPLRHNACASPKKIVVSAAISLKNAFMEMGRSYEQKSEGSEVVFNFGASGNLAGQIGGGAPADVFASASEKYMDDLEKKGLLLNGTRSDFAANSVVLIVPAGSKAISPSFEGLEAQGVRQIAVGNPGSVPAGRYAVEVLKYYKLLSSIKDKLIYGENVRQVLDYVARGEVDAGIVYSTDASIRAKEVRIMTIAPEKSHKHVVYPIAVVKGTKDEAAARAFIAFVLSPEGRKILAKYGFREGL